MKFIYHRGGYKESMETFFEFSSKQELFEIFKKDVKYITPNFSIDDIKCKYYAHDDRNGWDCHLVAIDGFGVMGYSDTQI